MSFFAASTVEHSLKIVDMGQSQQYVHAKPKQQYMTQMISTLVRGKKNFASFEIVIISSIRVEKVWFDVTNKANMEQQTFSRVNFFAGKSILLQ